MPVISGMDSLTTSTTAQFKLTDSESNVDFRCALDGAGFSACDKNPKYTYLAVGNHCFEAKAVDAAANTSGASKFCWTIDDDKKAFQVTGSTSEQFFPGKAQRVDLVFNNPNGAAIHVDSVSIAIEHATKRVGGDHPGSFNPNCDGTTNLIVSIPYSGDVTIPGNSQRSLTQLGVSTSRWPELTMPNLATPQDGCKDTAFTITYTGTASK
jgi:hypothetical protein